MRYYRVETDRRPHLAVRNGDRAFDLTGTDAGLRTFRDLARAARGAKETVDDIAARHISDAEEIPLDDLRERARRPLVPDEVWAAGVTYRISEEAREAESGMPEVYLDVYESDRPELFFKATASRTVGPREAVGVRRDSSWNVPEPELGIVLHAGEVVGYTVGNDVSSRSIEGRNPLYLPQAKIYDRCCSVGPCIATPDEVGDPHDLSMSMRIDRAGDAVYEETASTVDMVKQCEDLVEYFSRHNPVPETAVLLTGTGLVPEDSFTLEPGDRVRITIDRVGTLENTVVSV